MTQTLTPELERAAGEAIRELVKNDHAKRKKIISFNPPAPEPQSTTNSLEFPLEVMGGVAGEFANLYGEHLEPPKEFFFFGFLTCLGSLLSSRLTLQSEIKPQPRLYCILLGESASERKSTALSKTTDFFRETLEDFHTCYGVGSAEGLQGRLDDCKSQPLLLIYDELKAFVSKCRIDASVLLPCVNTLFESNRYESRTKNTTICLENAYLSILAASTAATFENMFSSIFTDIGFNNRLLIVPATGERKHAIPATIPADKKNILKRKLSELLQIVGNRAELEICQDARSVFDAWYRELEHSIHTKRLDTYALRLLPLLAINRAQTRITAGTVRQVIKIMDWQLAARQQYDPIDADSAVAKMEEKIRRTLKTRPLGHRDLKRACNANRCGLWVYETAIKNLTRGAEIFLQKGSQTWHTR